MTETSFFKCTRIVNVSTPDRDLGAAGSLQRSPYIITYLSGLSWGQDEVRVLVHIWPITFMFFHI